MGIEDDMKILASGEDAQQFILRAARVREAAQALLDALDLPPFGDGALARFKIIASGAIGDVVSIADAAEALRKALE